ncbi:MAG: hypothetical protein ACRDBM_16035, partial [Sporomusa sp.]
NQLRQFLEGLDGQKVKRVVAFSTAASSNPAQPLIAAALQPKGIPVEEDTFHCFGKFLFMHRSRPNEQDLQDAAHFATALIEKIV